MTSFRTFTPPSRCSRTFIFGPARGAPPTWMKTNGEFDRGNMKEDDATLGAHALYLARFVEEYEAQGIYVEAVHPQNEPGYLQDYPSCGWSPALMTEYIRDFLGPLFADRLPGRGIWVGTMSAPSDKNVVDAVMADSAAARLRHGDWRAVGPGPVRARLHLELPGARHADGAPLRELPQRKQHQSRSQRRRIRARKLRATSLTTFARAQATYMAWNMVLDTVGRNLDEVRPGLKMPCSPSMWARANSKSRPPTTSSVTSPSTSIRTPERVDVDGGDSVAWKNPDGDIVVVALQQWWFAEGRERVLGERTLRHRPRPGLRHGELASSVTVESVNACAAVRARVIA